MDTRETTSPRVFQFAPPTTFRSRPPKRAHARFPAQSELGGEWGGYGDRLPRNQDRLLAGVVPGAQVVLAAVLLEAGDRAVGVSAPHPLEDLELAVGQLDALLPLDRDGIRLAILLDNLGHDREGVGGFSRAEQFFSKMTSAASKKDLPIDFALEPLLALQERRALYIAKEIALDTCSTPGVKFQEPTAIVACIRTTSLVRDARPSSMTRTCASVTRPSLSSTAS